MKWIVKSFYEHIDVSFQSLIIGLVIGVLLNTFFFAADNKERIISLIFYIICVLLLLLLIFFTIRVNRAKMNYMISLKELKERQEQKQKKEAPNKKDQNLIIESNIIYDSQIIEVAIAHFGGNKLLKTIYICSLLAIVFSLLSFCVGVCFSIKTYKSYVEETKQNQLSFKKYMESIDSSLVSMNDKNGKQIILLLDDLSSNQDSILKYMKKLEEKKVVKEPKKSTKSINKNKKD